MCYLDNGSLACNFEDLTLSDRAISESHIDDLSVPIKYIVYGKVQRSEISSNE
jgi:hypothetical protein